MKIAVFYAHVREAAAQTGMSVEQILKKVKSFGFSGLECDFRDIGENPSSFLAKITAVGLEISGVYCFFDFGHKVDEAEIGHIVELVAAVGGKKILAIPGAFTPKSDRPRELAKMIEGTTLLCTYGAEYGITVTLEDFDDCNTPFSTDEELLYFLEQIPALRYTYDTGNFYYCDVDLLSAFDKLSPKMVHVHCKNRLLSPEFSAKDGKMTISEVPMYPAPVGVGVIPMKEAIGKILATGYHDYFTAEHFDAKDQLYCMEQSANWLKRELGI